MIAKKITKKKNIDAVPKRGSLVSIQENDRKFLRDFLTILTTPRGNRLYNPRFGTNFFKYIYERNIEEVRENLKEDLNNSFKVHGIFLKNIIVRKNDNDPKQIDCDLVIENIDGKVYELLLSIASQSVSILSIKQINKIYEDSLNEV